MKKAELEKNNQLIQCWNDIQYWIYGNCKELPSCVIPTTLKGVKVNICIEGGKIVLNGKDFTLYKSYYVIDHSKYTLKGIVRKMQQPFNILEGLVTAWADIKKTILSELDNQKKIFNFKA